MTEQSGDQKTLKLGDKVYSCTERDGVIEYNIVGVRLYNDATFYEIETSSIKLLIVDDGLPYGILKYTDVIEDYECTGFSSKYPKLYYVNKETAVHHYILTINSPKWEKIKELEEEARRLLLRAEELKKDLSRYCHAY